MRNHLDKSHQRDIDIKQGMGGLVDIEFLAQYLVLKNSHQYPNVAKYSDNVSIFTELYLSDIIDNQQKKLLTQAYCQLRDQSHRAALQDEDSLLEEHIFKQYAGDIVNIWQSFLPNINGR